MNPNAQPTRVKSFDRSALGKLLEPPYTDPYVRWCGRGGAARLPPIPICWHETDVAVAGVDVCFVGERRHNLEAPPLPFLTTLNGRWVAACAAGCWPFSPPARHKVLGLKIDGRFRLGPPSHSRRLQRMQNKKRERIKCG